MGIVLQVLVKVIHLNCALSFDVSGTWVLCPFGFHNVYSNYIFAFMKNTGGVNWCFKVNVIQGKDERKEG